MNKHIERKRELMQELAAGKLPDKELVYSIGEFPETDKLIIQEWHKRHRMTFPYKLDLSGNIVNGIIDMVFTDDEADPMILAQAKQARKGRG